MVYRLESIGHIFMLLLCDTSSFYTIFRRIFTITLCFIHAVVSNHLSRGFQATFPPLMATRNIVINIEQVEYMSALPLNIPLRQCSACQILLVLTPYILPDVNCSVSSVLESYPCMSRPLHLDATSYTCLVSSPVNHLKVTNACLPRYQTSRRWGV